MQTKMQMGKEYKNFGTFAKEYILKILSEVSEDRLSKDKAIRTQKLIQEQWKLVDECGPLKQLCHCDFNPKNVLVDLDNDARVGVLDWEFGISGHGLIDLGNFFRFMHDYPTGADVAFIEGYSDGMGGIYENWREAARLLDLLHGRSKMKTRNSLGLRKYLFALS